MSAVPTELAETVQAGHINRHPDPKQDLAPETAADKKEPVTLHSPKRSDIDVSEEEEEEDIPYSVLRPVPRAHNLPPLPDLRFEQSYLHSIAAADTWWKVALITTRDQVMMPLVQGVLYNLFVLGWRHWNQTAQVSGNTVGARVRRWWYNVNNWPIHGGEKR